MVIPIMVIVPALVEKRLLAVNTVKLGRDTVVNMHFRFLVFFEGIVSYEELATGATLFSNSSLGIGS